MNQPVHKDGPLSTHHVVGGYKPQEGPPCPSCKSTDTEAVARDLLWDETTCQCSKCGKMFIK